MQKCPCGLDGLKEVSIANRAGHYEIYRAGKKRLQRFQQSELGIGVLARRKGFELDEKIEVASLRIEVGSSG